MVVSSMDTYNDLSKGFIVPRNPVTSLLLIPTVAIPILFVTVVYNMAKLVFGLGSKTAEHATPEKMAA